MQHPWEFSFPYQNNQLKIHTFLFLFSGM